MKITLVFSLLALPVVMLSDDWQCPTVCSCLEMDGLVVVDCWGRSLLSLPKDIHPQVQVLDVSNNGIRTIVGSIGQYPMLQRLYLSRNQIQALPSTALKNLPSLEHLDLSFNNISDLSQINADTFIVNNTLLKELNLAGNPITNLGTDTKSVTSILTSSSLRKLHLSECKIDAIAGTAALKNLPKLEYLDLSKNPIKWMRSFGSPSLIHVDVSYCELDFLSPTALIGLPSLRNLSLTGNTALSLTAGGLISNSMSVLEAAHCSVTRPRLSGLPNLVSANFRGNKITRLREEEFKSNRYLKVLDLSENTISEIHSGTFSGAEYLETLNIAHNMISNELPPNIFSKNQYLKDLNVSKNDLSRLKNFDNPSLKHLDVSQCKIRTLDQNVMSKLPWLVSLKLSENLLQDIPNGITSNTLMNLDLSYCRLSTIRNETFSNLKLLNRLDLTGNRLTEPIDVTILQRLPNLKDLRLGDNPWHCNCESKKFQSLWEYITAGEKILKTESRFVKCQTPEKYRGISWENSCYTEWYPAPPNSKAKFTQYTMICLVSVFSIAAVFAIASTIMRKIYSRKKRRQAREERRELDTRMAQVRANQHSRQSLEDDATEEDVVIRLQDSPETRPRWISLPPTYDEAVLMSQTRLEDEESSASAGRTAISPSKSDTGQGTSGTGPGTSGTSLGTDPVTSGARRSPAEQSTRVRADSSSDSESETLVPPSLAKRGETSDAEGNDHEVATPSTPIQSKNINRGQPRDLASSD